MASAVENVVYFAFLGLSVSTVFWRGAKERAVLSTLFVLGFGGFFAFRRLFTKPLFYRVFGWSPASERTPPAGPLFL